MVSLRGPLILLLGLLLPAVSYATVHEYQYEAAAACNAASKPYGHHPESCQVDGNYTPNENYAGRYISKGCNNAQCTSWGYTANHYWRKQDCDVLPHEPDPLNPDYQPTLCGMCEGSHHDMGEDFVQQAPHEYRCELKEDVSQCREKGEYWIQIGDEPFASEGYCRPTCDNGIAFEGACLEETEDTCTTMSPDFQGTIGWGENQRAICSGDTDCGEGETFGLIDTGNGTEKACISDDLGPPTCDSDGVLIMDDYGFVCETPEGGPEDEETEEPNTDTDGDGEPDEYDRTNDPDAGNKQRDDMIDGIEGINDRLDGIGKSNKKGNETLDDISGGIGEINDKLGQETGDGESIPTDTGTVTGSLGRIRDAIMDHPTLETMTSVPSVPSVSTCPTWTIPANEYWSALTIDSHCQPLENNRGLLSLIFMGMWSLVAIVVFLRA